MQKCFVCAALFLWSSSTAANDARWVAVESVCTRAVEYSPTVCTTKGLPADNIAVALPWTQPQWDPREAPMGIKADKLMPEPSTVATATAHR